MRRVLVVALLAVAACGGDGDPDGADRAEPGSPTTARAAPSGDGEVPPLGWEPCGSAECASVAVPVDHADPDGASLDLAVLRLPARADRLGALFVNFGGPGSSTTSTAVSFPFPDEVRDRFDIVAVDPRGVGGSAPLECGLPPAELYAVDHSIEDDDDADALIAVSEDYAADCQASQGEILPHVGTRAVARDLDVVRAAMGLDRLDFLGYSYGTVIGQAYAELFPDRVRTMVLDGVVDPEPDGIDVATQQAVGFETALARWADGCDGRSSCGFDDPVGAVEDALAAAEDGVPAGDRTLGPGEATIGTAMALYATGLWPLLDAAVTGVLEGDGRPLLDLADQYVTLVDFSAYFAVSCLDTTWPETPEEHLSEARAAAREAPRFGETIVNDYLRCTVWPVPPDPLGPIVAAGSGPILVVSTTGDPATPHDSATRVDERLERSVLLTHEGDGHTIVFQGNACVDAAALTYLLDEMLPAEGTRC